MSEARGTRRLVILGSTGSIGVSALEVVRRYRDRFEVVGLGAHANVDLLTAQMQEFRPPFAALADRAAARRLRAAIPSANILDGPEGLEALAALDVDVVLCAMVGAAGLQPVLRAIDAGNAVALANKEPVVMAGRLIMERAARRGVPVLPVDSEHNAIFQCIQGHAKEDVRSIHLTASGGPFYGRPRVALRDVTPEQATRHPTWKMGAKVSVDSATLMNKGLEIIEAMWLFDLPARKIEVIIHPQSVVHGLVEFNDGHILAHLSVTDMKFPILFALTYPERVASPMERLNLAALQSLSFDAPDFDAFPCLAYARQAAFEGGTAPAILNAANEEAVAAFCARRISFLGISDVVGDVCDACAVVADNNLETVLAADEEARRRARAAVETMIARV
ncbi:MAG: 1-deoxy-D-xylulose-5-phosphate reductoisomerase [Candidatus Hydrogenedentes bacterium]|nr:1-deoxy-D-xylulose-5-phosphate reductoisomerase [Candidatus Hydrogenedentota bacterium]